VPELERLIGHGEAATSACVGPAALQGRVLEGAWGRRLGVRKGRQDAHVTVDVWVIFYACSGLKLKLMEKGMVVLPRDSFSPA
jgi:hypothetical protein